MLEGEDGGGCATSDTANAKEGRRVGQDACG